MNKYLNPANYGRAGIAFLNRCILNTIEPIFAPNPKEPLRHRPIFFLGAPRSGSTLMVQVVTDAFDLGYISNRHCQWFGYPALAERLFHPIKDKPVSDYQSSHGNTKGWYSPAECGQLWYRFFRRNPSYVTLQDVDEGKMLRFRQSVAALTNACDRPIVFKNLYASLRIQAIARYLPESLFIVTHRNEIDNGHSLLETRYRNFNDYNTWWSMEPPDLNYLKTLPAHQQVIEQIRHIHATIDRDLKLAGVPDTQRFDLCYEEFCQDTHGKLDELESFLISNQSVTRRQGRVPLSFDTRNEIRIDEKLYSAMTSYARRI